MEPTERIWDFIDSHEELDSYSDFSQLSPEELESIDRELLEKNL